MEDKRNLEQQLADKLGNRSIAPSEQAWDRIAHNREQGKNKKKKKRTVVYYYAASVVLFILFAGYFFVSDNSGTIAEPQIVNSGNTEEAIDKNTPVAVPETELLPKQNERTVVYQRNEQKANLPDVYKEKTVKAAAFYKKPEVNEGFPEISVAALPDRKILSKDEIYEQEVDYLLKNAIKEVAADKQFKTSTNDTALLKEVEAEMDDYYRQKTMKIFSLQNKTIRIAVKDKQ